MSELLEQKLDGLSVNHTRTCLVLDDGKQSRQTEIEEFLRAYDIENAFNKSFAAYQVECPFCGNSALIKPKEHKILYECCDSECRDAHLKSDPWNQYKQFYTGRNDAAVLEEGENLIYEHVGVQIDARREPDLDCNKDGMPKKTPKNCIEIIKFDNGLYGNIGYNLLAHEACVLHSVPWDPESGFRQWTDSDDAKLRNYIGTKYGIDSRLKIQDAFIEVSEEKGRCFNPVTVLLGAIYKQWVQNPTTGTIEKLLPCYMGAEDTAYTAEVMKLFMLGAICRAHDPGCKFDYMPILTGQQGMFKSTFIRALALNDDWFSDDIKDIRGKDAQEKLRGKWLVEFEELQAFSKAEVTELKSWISRRADDYREAYARRTSNHKRMCVLIGTTNEKGFLTDKTGNRRYLPVECRKEHQQASIYKDMDSFKNDIVNAWGEAMNIYVSANGKPSLILPEHLQEEAIVQQNAHMEEDFRVGQIQSWLEEKGNGFVFCSSMVMCEVFENDHPNKYEVKQVKEIIENQLEGVKPYGFDKTGRKTFPKYGKQRAYVFENVQSLDKTMDKTMDFMSITEGELIFD